MYKAFEIKSYVNKLQNYNYVVKVMAIDLTSGRELSPDAIEQITEEDMIDFERGIGRELLVTYNDTKSADKAEISRLIYNFEGDIALIYHIKDNIEGKEWTYIEVYSSGVLKNKHRFMCTPEKALKEILLKVR